MKGVRPLLATAVLLALAGCGMPYAREDDDGWRPFGAGSPIFSSGGTFGRSLQPSGYGSRLTVPRITGVGTVPDRLGEEDGNIWPEPEVPRPTLTDPAAVTQGVPAFRPDTVRPQPAPPSEPPRGRAPGASPGEIILRPDGLPAVTGAGTDSVWTYEVPGRAGVGTVVPDAQGGRILVEPNGRTIPIPR